MYESLLQSADDLFPDKAFLTIEDVAKFLDCEEQVIHHWTKRPNIQKRPPRLMVGKTTRFPKKDFVRWLSSELISGVE